MTRLARTLCLLLLLPVPVLAHEVSIGTAASPTKPVVVWRVAEQRSKPGESRDAFVTRLAPALRAYSAQAGHEAGGLICQGTDGTWGLVVQTVHAHANLPITTVCPDGLSPTAWSIHTHPAQPFIVANAVDVAFLGRGHREGEVLRTEGQWPSAADYAQPGYVVTPDRIFAQAGRHAVRALAP